VQGCGREESPTQSEMSNDTQSREHGECYGARLIPDLFRFPFNVLRYTIAR
jgi:hypothetical protein